ncbi:MAG: SDR family NAD(P)-dependent oxidoreductase [Rhodospirillaceae bacterium]|nr:SDR family NAD(P)-dependent oxidoreductase [Rhodospirillaceae bacterium]
MQVKEIGLIVGAGEGLSAAVARIMAREGMAVALAARSLDNLAALAKETDAKTYACDASDTRQVASLFESVDRDVGTPTWVLFNPSRRSRGPLVDLDPETVKQDILVTCFGGFLVGQQAAKRMVKAGGGSIFFTGASASVKGYARSAPFAMGKFGLRGLAQSMAREFQPQNLHIAHFVIDGSIAPRGGNGKDDRLNPDSIAETYLAIHRQHRSAWTWEIELRPWTETF